MRARILGWLGAVVLRIWTWTLRYHIVGPTPCAPGLVAFWHGRQLPLLGVRPSGVIVPVSLSRDGQLQAAILGRCGIQSVRGSSSRGGARAARGLLRAISRGALAAIAVDGPRGPFGAVKPGVVYLARRTRVPIWPVAVAARRGRELAGTWDRYLLPLPFTRTAVVIGSPISVSEDGDVEPYRAALESALEAAHVEANAMVGHA